MYAHDTRSVGGQSTVVRASESAHSPHFRCYVRSFVPPCSLPGICQVRGVARHDSLDSKLTTRPLGTPPHRVWCLEHDGESENLAYYPIECTITSISAETAAFTTHGVIPEACLADPAIKRCVLGRGITRRKAPGHQANLFRGGDS